MAWQGWCPAKVSIVRGPIASVGGTISNNSNRAVEKKTNDTKRPYSANIHLHEQRDPNQKKRAKVNENEKKWNKIYSMAPYNSLSHLHSPFAYLRVCSSAPCTVNGRADTHTHRHTDLCNIIYNMCGGDIILYSIIYYRWPMPNNIIFHWLWPLLSTHTPSRTQKPPDIYEYVCWIKLYIWASERVYVAHTNFDIINTHKIGECANVHWVECGSGFIYIIYDISLLGGWLAGTVQTELCVRIMIIY